MACSVLSGKSGTIEVGPDAVAIVGPFVGVSVGLVVLVAIVGLEVVGMSVGPVVGTFEGLKVGV